MLGLTLTWGTVASLMVFAFAWVVSSRLGNYGFLDVTWACSIGALALAYSLAGDGFWLRRLLLGGIAVVWSLRLGIHILRRVLRHHPEEDPRYKSLRKDWPSPFRFFLFFELQAVIAVILAFPFLIAAFQSSPRLHILEIIGCTLALLALAGESLADHQLQVFHARHSQKAAICRTGLWRYSRHPNYFFESLIWWGFFLAVLPFPWGWACVLCPLMMLWFLLKVTGIPLAEHHSLAKHGEAYRAYQRSTSPFVPWFPKSP